MLVFHSKTYNVVIYSCLQLINLYSNQNLYNSRLISALSIVHTLQETSVAVQFFQALIILAYLTQIKLF